MVSPRVLRLWVAVAVVLGVTAGAGYWLSRPDASAWAGGTDGTVSQRDGEDGCAGLVLLDIRPDAGLGASGQFVRDADGVLSEAELAQSFARATGSIRRFGPDATIPENGVLTPWTRGDGAELWLAPGADDYAYVAGDVVEAWPRAEPELPCSPDSRRG